MRKLALTLLAAGTLFAGVTGQAEAYQPAVPCYRGYDGEWDWRYKVRPRGCMFNGDEAHYATMTLSKMTWRTWGGKTACGHGDIRYNSGYRSRTSFCLYALNDVQSYTRIRGRAGNRACSYGVTGHYGCSDQKPYRWDLTTR